MMRCKPLLGTYVEVSIQDKCKCFNQRKLNAAFDAAFFAIATVQQHMAFHNPFSELSKINQSAHVSIVNVHPWTYQLLSTAKEVHRVSNGLFDCGVGAKLIAAGLLPSHGTRSDAIWGGLGDLILLGRHQVCSLKPLRLDLGGIAKGFAVDKAVGALQASGIPGGSVNAGGDLRIFGCQAQEIQLRSSSKPTQLIPIGTLADGSIASSGDYGKGASSHIINPITGLPVLLSKSFSVIAEKCVHADALTKVLAITQDEAHPCFQYFSATPLCIPT